MYVAYSSSQLRPKSRMRPTNASGLMRPRPASPIRSSSLAAVDLLPALTMVNPCSRLSAAQDTSPPQLSKRMLRMKCQISTNSILAWAKSGSCFFHHFQPTCSRHSTPSTIMARCQGLLALSQLGLMAEFSLSCRPSMVVSWVLVSMLILSERLGWETSGYKTCRRGRTCPSGSRRRAY